MAVTTWRRRLRIVLVVALLLTGAVWLNNTSLLAPASGEVTLLAHRGLSQTFDLTGVRADTCTATRIHPPDHEHLENTIPSIRAAFAAGADVVELDLRLTRDDRFAVFHDDRLECRTDGRGAVSDHTLAQLRQLDIGHGYTADGGKTYPFRGKAVGLMPSLEEVLDAFAGRSLLLHVKGEQRREGVLLARRLASLPASVRRQIAVYGGDAPIAAVGERLPKLRVMSRATLKSCLGRYAAVGWTGYVPGPCRGTQLHIPENIGPWLWGWPHRFVARMAAYDTRVVIVAGSGGWSEGFDDPDAVERLPKGYAGTVWTNRIDTVAPLLRP